MTRSTHPTPRERQRILNAPPATRRVLFTAAFWFIAMVPLWFVGFLLVPSWAGTPPAAFVVFVNALAVLAGLLTYYMARYITIHLPRWKNHAYGLFMFLCAWLMTVISVGESLPALSTYVWSTERTIVVEVTGTYRGSLPKSPCKSGARFGSLWSLKGRTCSGRVIHSAGSKGYSAMVTGPGNVFGVRVETIRSLGRQGTRPGA